MHCIGLKNYCLRVIHFIPVIVFLLLTGDKAMAQAKPGRLTGNVHDEDNRPVNAVSITVDKQKKATTTSVSGDYVLALEPGTYVLLFSAVGYVPQRITEVIIKSNEETFLNITLSAKKDTLTGVVLQSTARRAGINGLLQAQKSAPDMRDGVSAEQLARLPVNNVAQALTKVSGVTIQNEKFVTIRGVSDRYNNAMINGSSLPSTEPNRRNFSFDIVPSALVDNVTVNKTATPDLPGEFTGGIVQINTKDVPTKNFLEITIGTGINTESYDRGYYSFKRDKNAWIGKVDGERKWYGEGRLIDPEVFFTQFSMQDTAAMRKSTSQIPNRWQRFRYGYTPAQTYQVTGGLNKRFGNGKSLGLVAAFTYQNEQLYETGESRSLSVFEGINTRTKYTTAIGGLLNAAYKTSKHKLAWKNLYNHRYSLQSDEANVFNWNISNPQMRYIDVVFSGTLFQTKLEGEHVLTKSNIKAEWFADYIKYNREQPDSRFLSDIRDQPPFSNYRFNELSLPWGGLFSSVLKEDRNNAGVSISLPFEIKEEKELIKIGYAWSKRDAAYDGAGYRIRETAAAFGSSQKGLPYYEIVKQENIRNGNLYFYPAYVKNSGTGDRYSGVQELHAIYAMADIRLMKKWRLIGGVRNENNRMDLSTVFITPVTTAPWILKSDTTKSYPENDWLPSVNLIYSINDKMNLRAAFSKTLARPDFFERSPFRYFDFAEQLEVFGDNELEITRIKNYDLRYEFYSGPGEILSASVFYKDFDKPVERFFVQGNPTNSVVFTNLYKAKAMGFELDVRKSMSFINPLSPVLKNLFFSGNFAYISGDITANVTKSPFTNADTFYILNERRPIQNLAPYLINLGVGYQLSSWGFNLAFNRSGRKIVNGGTRSSLIQYESPRNILDLQLNAKMWKQKLEWRFNISNILDAPFIIYSNGTDGGDPNNDPKGDAFNNKYDYVWYRVKKGVGLTLKAVYRF